VAGALGCAKSTVQRALTATGTPPRTRRKHATDNSPETYHVGQLPYGKKAGGGRIVDHIGEQRVIRTMERMRGEGASFAAITKYLNSKGIRTKRGKTWHHAAIARILCSRC